MTAPVLLDVSDRVATITLNRPKRRNAADPAMLDHLLVALRTVRADNRVRVVVLTGAGGAFCAGADLTEDAISQLPPDCTRGQGVRWLLEHCWNAAVANIIDLGKPTIAAVAGVAAGGGVGLALACDIVIAADTASFVQPFVPQLAVVPDVGSSWFLPRLIGVARARALMLLGDPLPASTAAAWGMIWQSVPDEQLAATTTSLAARLADLDPEAAARAKAAIVSSIDNGLHDQLALEARWQADLVDRPAFREGVSAFLEKRRPRFDFTSDTKEP
ncbi:MAG TPA: enoyl-CoA hydratase-related protein [Mycobacterium sp.]|jgi:2-(1,2-epoxy-1,2-dihydrophenyl)acetyl-CoA isomerase